jgi:hypothetical protein
MLCGILFSVVASAQSTTWTDPSTKRMWAKEDNGSDVNWNQASSYCQSLRLEGYSNWRLATIDELAFISDPTAPRVGYYNYHAKGDIKLSGGTWSSSAGEDSGEAWSFLFNHGGIRASFLRDLSKNLRALCVRP